LGFAVALAGAVALLFGVEAAQPTTVSGCSPLRLSFGPAWSEATGQETSTFVFKNLSGRRCSFDGYPKIAFLDGRGRVLGFTYYHGGDQMITTDPPHLVVVANGGRLFFAINKLRCDVRETAIARTIRIKLPGNSTWLAIPLRLGYCGGGEPSGVISVSPVVASMNAAARRH